MISVLVYVRSWINAKLEASVIRFDFAKIFHQPISLCMRTFKSTWSCTTILIMLKFYNKTIFMSNKIVIFLLVSPKVQFGLLHKQVHLGIPKHLSLILLLWHRVQNNQNQDCRKHFLQF